MKFLHAADIHLDSALAGACRKDQAPVEALRSSTRRAFARVIDIALAEDVAFVVIAGDLYDAAWRDYGTGLFFEQQIRRLKERPCFLVLGNHDAQSVITAGLKLSLPANLRLFSHRHCETYELPELGVAVHGQSFPNRAVDENLSLRYKPRVKGRLNVGLLHTSLDGRAGHDTYAPCSVADLAAHEYDYWALGHVHAREIVSRSPWIVFPGNTQGRSVREAGARSCTVVQVADGRIVHLEEHPTDVLRWAQATADLTGLEDIQAAKDKVQQAIADAASESCDLPLATRLTLRGPTLLHRGFVADFPLIEAECRAAAGRVSDRIWLEKLEIRTRTAKDAAGDPPGGLQAILAAVLDDPATIAGLQQELAAVLGRVPLDAQDEELRALLSEAGLNGLVADAWDVVAQGLQAEAE